MLENVNSSTANISINCYGYHLLLIIYLGTENDHNYSISLTEGGFSSLGFIKRSPMWSHVWKGKLGIQFLTDTVGNKHS